MGLIGILAALLAVWALATGKIEKPGSRQSAALALAAIGLVLLGRGKPLPAIALIAAGAALWPWGKRPSTPRISAMDVMEARALLGVAADADEDTIRAAHRRLITQTHPDRGGTQALASRINQARDVALSAIIHK